MNAYKQVLIESLDSLGVEYKLTVKNSKMHLGIFRGGEIKIHISMSFSGAKPSKEDSNTFYRDTTRYLISKNIDYLCTIHELVNEVKAK